jgi:general secretion pathway protein G
MNASFKVLPSFEWPDYRLSATSHRRRGQPGPAGRPVIIDTGQESRIMLISRRESGFTLIEIMVVLVIIAILSALIAPQILGRVDEARVTAARQDIRTLGTALDFYKMDNFRYPTTEQGLEALVKQPEPPPPHWRAGGYLKATTVPKDPWGNEYRYLYPGQKGGEYDLFSLGADGEPGGEDADADVGSWNLE